jgi:hypothetical protein
MNKKFLYITLGLVAFGMARLHAEQSKQSELPVVLTAPGGSPMPVPIHATNPYPAAAGQQSMLTPEESKILSQARMELQKDPELLDLRNQIKTLIDKQASLTLEKLRKINPEAAVIQQKLNERQEKMMAARRSQMEAMQAKFKAQQANSESQKENDAPAAKVVVP